MTHSPGTGKDWLRASAVGMGRMNINRYMS
uniref:Uncharacterized protein n=1 Tax=Picea glauca TaxID=3330 RepID=A0A101LTX7_PICGL|nr:hypothetical protein ABT39_MTgene3504 [Picea glauca]